MIGVSRMFQKTLKSLARESFKVVSRKIKGCFKGALREFKGISKKFKGCLKEI